MIFYFSCQHIRVVILCRKRRYYAGKGECMNHEEKHWHGTKNKAIRWYFYSQRGLALFNEFRYVLMLIFGAYVLLKLDNPIWLVIMFLTSLPILVAVGWYQTHHMAKVMDWLGTQFASYWGRYSFDLQERQVKAIETILEEIKCARNKQ
jgi:hypothetical protein